MNKASCQIYSLWWQSAEQEHYISQLAFALADKYVVIKPPQNHIFTVVVSGKNSKLRNHANYHKIQFVHVLII
jgi:uncharacterized coiled-coil protein SlyX